MACSWLVPGLGVALPYDFVTGPANRLSVKAIGIPRSPAIPTRFRVTRAERIGTVLLQGGSGGESVLLRRNFDGSSMVLRWIFDGFHGFFTLFLQSLLPARPPCHPP